MDEHGSVVETVGPGLRGTWGSAPESPALFIWEKDRRRHKSQAVLPAMDKSLRFRMFTLTGTHTLTL